MNALSLCAQDCPKENPNGPPTESKVVSVTGTAVLHNGIRRWMELKPDTVICGARSIQMLKGTGGAFEVDEGSSLEFEPLRGCRVTAQGELGLPGTGYYSAPLYLNVEKIGVEPGCVRKPLIPVYWNAKPDARVNHYRVSMQIHYRGDGSVTAMVRDGGRTLAPWQAYAKYWLTGGFVFYGECADGFMPSNMWATRAAKPDLIDSQIALDPESAAQKGVWNLGLNYTCTRTPPAQ